jgi:HAD superfamily hydrolase (TIGR01509 family)
MSESAGVLLDVDGTLVDSAYLHTLAWSRAFRDAGTWAPMNAIHRLVGMGGDQMVPELLDRPCDEAHDAWRQHYNGLKAELRPFPAARDLIQARHERGVIVVLATSSPQEDLDELRKVIDADDWIDAVTTADDVEHSKPAPDIFEAALRAGKIDRRKAIAVGDSVWDVRSARAAGLACLGVETGGFSRHELAEDGAIAVYHDVGELLAQLDVGPLGRVAELASRSRPH